MKKIDKILFERTVSSFPVSIGTAIALESLFEGSIDPYDKDREITRVDIRKWDIHLISLKTIIRNFIGSIEGIHKELIMNNPRYVAEHIFRELLQIEELYRIEGNSSIRPVFYWNNYRYLLLEDKVPILKIRKLTKSNSQVLSFSDKVFRLIEPMAKDSGLDIRIEKSFIPQDSGNALITTHMPHELLNVGSFKKVGLLESYTGVLKDRGMWSTKYYNYRDNKVEYSRLPFVRPILYILGDSGLIAPHKKSIRERLLDVAKARRFMVTTTESKVWHYLRSDMGIGRI